MNILVSAQKMNLIMSANVFGNGIVEKQFNNVLTRRSRSSLLA
ncbi:hypothetical protein JOC73_001354 [Alkaliphilus hydrothermalis]|uniref:Uncharacterized protein n=1 Tax=Alkaliphilus hydrothermalis TaxID=1482730 RepID=A0ABS2NPG3_9FIRM|nr:hypothetical protein [Alkaliphilus hydrothermalis]